MNGYGAGQPPFIQQQKITLGKQCDLNDKFNRALYSNLQKTVEDVVPGVAPLNRELSKYKVVKPILQRAFAAEENKDVMNAIISRIILSYALKKLGTPQGKKTITDVFKAAALTVERAEERLQSLIPTTAFTMTRNTSRSRKRAQLQQGQGPGPLLLASL